MLPRTGSMGLGGLLNTAPNYAYPLTGGLLSSLTAPPAQNGLLAPQGSLGTAPPGVPNYSAMALQMAGNPHAGPYAGIAAPQMGAAGTGVPTQTGGSVGSTAGGLLAALAGNPNLASQAVGLLGKVANPILSSIAPNTSTTGFSTGNNLLNTDASNYLATGDPTYGIPGLDSTSSSDPFTSLDNSQLLDPSMWGFNGAGGPAATTAAGPTDALSEQSLAPGVGYLGTADPAASSAGGLPQGLGGALSAGGNALSIVNGIRSGTPLGDASAAISAAALGSKLGLVPSSVGSAAGAVAPGIGLIGGIEQGGVAGDTQAAVSAAQLANESGLLGSGPASGAVSALGDVALPVALFAALGSLPGGYLSGPNPPSPMSEVKTGLSQSPTTGAANPLTGQAVGNPNYTLAQQLQAALNSGNTSAVNAIYQQMLGMGGGSVPHTLMR